MTNKERYEAIKNSRSNERSLSIADQDFLIERVFVTENALEYIIHHERYHGINQGEDSDFVAEKALKFGEEK